MENKIRFVNSRFDTQRGVQLEDGRIITLMDETEHLYLRYDYALDLENGTFDPDNDEYNLTLNGLISTGKAKEVRCYDICDYNTDVFPDDFIPDSKIDDAEYVENKIRNKAKEIKKWFKSEGYDVELVDIIYNITNWFHDYKSGCRNEDKGYHLFTPCGHNPLSIRLSTLHERCKDWQITYYC